jgi:hypothetical protein
MSRKAFSAYFAIRPTNKSDNYVPHGSKNQNKNMMYHGSRRLTKAAIATHPWLQGVKTSNQGNSGQEQLWLRQWITAVAAEVGNEDGNFGEGIQW